MTSLFGSRASAGRCSSETEDHSGHTLPALWLASTEAVETDRIAEHTLLAPLSADERQRWRSFHFRRDRDLFLVAHYLKRRVLSMYQSELDTGDWQFATTAQGKPVIAAEHNRSGLCFNLSHAHRIAAVLVTRGQICGVDVERSRRDADHRDLARSALHPREARDVALRGSEAFYQYWTLKEAFAKLHGAGPSLPLDSFHIELDSVPRVIVDAGAASADVELFQCRLPEDYFLAAAVRGRADHWPPALHWLEELAPDHCGNIAVARSVKNRSAPIHVGQATPARRDHALSEHATVSASSSWWIRITQPVAPRLRLFCFPFAGALPNYFRQFAGRIPADIELWALQLPGRGARAREPLLHDMHAITAPLARAMTPHLDLPFAFFGHSMGAAVSFALARRLRDQGLPLPLHMIVSGCRPVHLERPLPCVHRMNLDELTEELRILGGTPEAVLQDGELLQFYAPAIRADFEVLESYVPGRIEPLPIDVSLWAGIHDPRVAVDTVAAWGELFTGERQEIHFPGGHMFIDSGQSQSQCLDELERVLARCTDHPAHHQHQRRTGT